MRSRPGPARSGAGVENNGLPTRESGVDTKNPL